MANPWGRQDSAPSDGGGDPWGRSPRPRTGYSVFEPTSSLDTSLIEDRRPAFQTPRPRPAPAPDPDVYSRPDPLPAFENDEPWQTSLFNVGKRVGQGVQDLFSEVSKKPIIGGALQGLGTVGSVVASPFNAVGAFATPQGRRAMQENYRTLDNQEPGFFDVPAVSRALAAGSGATAGAFGQLAEDQSLPEWQRGIAGAAQFATGALPNIARQPAVFRPAFQAARAVLPAVGSAAEVVRGASGGVQSLINRRLPNFATAEGGAGRTGAMASEDARQAAIRKAQEAFGNIEGVQKVGEEPVTTSTAPAARASHLDPAVVGVEKAARNQAVHNAHAGLVEAVKQYQANPTPQLEAVMADHLSTLKANGVADASTLAKLKQAGIAGLPGTRSATARLAAARVKATETPSMTTQRELAAARGVDPEAAVKGTTTPATTAAVLRQQLQGKTEGPVPVPPKKSMGALMAERAAILRGGDQPRSLRFGLDQEKPLPVPPPLKGALAPEGPNVPLKPDTISLMPKAESPVINPMNTTVQSQLVKPLSTKPAEVLKPAQAGQLRTNTQPLVTTTGPKVGTKVAGGVVAQRASATAGVAVKRKVTSTPVAPATLVTPPLSPPPPPMRKAPAVVAPAPAAGAPSIPAPSQPLVGPVTTRTNAVTQRIAQGATTGKTKVAPTPGQLSVKQNMTTLQWEVKQSNGTIIGTGATRSQAIKAGQGYLANNPVGGGGTPPPGKPPVGTGGVGPGQGGRPPVKHQNIITEALNAPRVFETTGDVSNNLRQGFLLAAGHPAEAIKQFANTAKYLAHVITQKGDEFAYKTMDDWQKEPEWARTQKLGLETTSWDGSGMMEEGFQSSRLAQLPIIKQSNIAGVLFLNGMRYNVAKSVLKGAPSASDKQLGAVMKFINAASGRGNLPKVLNDHAALLNGFLYSPKFQWSRVEVAAAPLKAALTRNPILAKEAVRDIAASYIAGRLITGLAKINGAKVEEDDTSPDWGKIQVGNTRVDIWGGYQPIARIINQAVEGKRTTIGTNGAPGQVIMLDRGTGMPIDQTKSAFSQLMDKYRPNSPGEDFFKKSIYGKFLRSKLSPVAGAALDWQLGEDYAGQKFDAGHTAARMVTPLGWQDIFEATMDDIKNGGSGARGAITGTLSLLGEGVQTIPNDNQQYPLIPEVIAGAVTKGLNGASQTHDAFPSSSPKASATPKPTTKKKTPGGNPFGR